MTILYRSNAPQSAERHRRLHSMSFEAVPREAAAPRIVAGADATLKRLEARMGADVLSQVTAVSKELAAEVATVWFLARVDA